MESVRRLDEEQVRLADIALHRPTLDDVFLSLTGHAAEADGSGADEETSRRRRGRRKSGS
jgi:ABC-2 type transport system ATP-binding protein